MCLIKRLQIKTKRGYVYTQTPNAMGISLLYGDSSMLTAGVICINT